MRTLKSLNWAEPARLRAVWAALLGLAVALGITVPAEIDGTVQALIVAVATLLPLLQGEATRKAVFSPETAERLLTQHPEPMPSRQDVFVVEADSEDELS